jgi:hypothetical protein
MARFGRNRCQLTRKKIEVTLCKNVGRKQCYFFLYILCKRVSWRQKNNPQQNALWHIALQNLLKKSTNNFTLNRGRGNPTHFHGLNEGFESFYPIPVENHNIRIKKSWQKPKDEKKCHEPVLIVCYDNHWGFFKLKF